MPIPRRDFLKWSAGGLGATLLAPTVLEADGRAGGPGVGSAERLMGAVGPGDAVGVQEGAGALTFDPFEYAGRRARFMEQIGDGVAVLLGSLSGRQNNEIRYYSGVDVPGTILVMDGLRGESTLFYSTTERYLRGENLDPALATDPVKATGVEKHYPADEFTGVFSRLAASAEVVHTPFRSEVSEREVSTESEWDGRRTRRQRFVAVLKERFPGTRVEDCAETIWEQRRIKTAAEVEAIRRAGRIGASAMVEVLRAARPGMYEYELSALYEYVCKRQGARELAFDTIISSAENHPYLHYAGYDRHLVEGDFLVFDAAPRWQDYCMDTTISFPIDGRFSPRQREIYTACLEISKGCLARYRPGITGFEIGEQVRGELEERGYDLSGSAFTRMRFFDEGGITHHVGLETHDAGGSDLPPDRPLEEGMVFACDVFGTWPDEELGVRVENTVLVTADGCEVLNPGVPREIEEIERLLGSSPGPSREGATGPRP